MSAALAGTMPSSRPADLTPVSAIMARDVVTVPPDLPIDAFEALLVAKGISGAPVVDAAGNAVGIVSKTDLLQVRDAAAGKTVESVMMPTTFCLAENESIAKAAGLMAYEGVHRVPVVDASGRVIGIVSPLDVLRWLARENGYVVGNRR